MVKRKKAVESPTSVGAAVPDHAPQALAPPPDPVSSRRKKSATSRIGESALPPSCHRGLTSLGAKEELAIVAR